MPEKTDRRKMSYVRNFFRNPDVAAVAPSSPEVVARVRDAIPHGARTVIEFGPGDGVATKEILLRVARDGKLFVVESDPAFAEHMRKLKEVLGDDRLAVIEGRAQDISQTYDEQFKNADAIVASIPYSLLSSEDRFAVTRRAYELLKPGASFVVFHQYRLVAKDTMRRVFGNVSTERIWSWPPCHVFTSVKKRE